MSSLRFTQVVEIEKWQKIQDHFSEVLKVSLCTVDREGVLFTQYSMPARICEEVMRSSLKGMMLCKGCLQINYEEKEREWREGFRCKAGLFHSFIIPLKVKEETLAYLVVGPVMLGKPNLEFYKKKVESLDIDYERFLDALREVKSFSFYGIKSVIELLYDIACYICELGYQNLALKEIMPDTSAILGRVHTFYTEKLLGALLDVSYNFVEAERGSIMLLDEEKKELYIKIAKGLSREIVENTRIRIGESLSGLVVQRKKPLLVGKEVDDELIKSRLVDPQRIKYSILIPIRKGEEILGVLNISTLKEESDKFSWKGMQTVDELIKLVETALSGISS
ncbi:MAG: hypothetical protein DRP76_02485 [Candidatus Omnitrophota bacterium]|nr:MAG: hypothetical protein DRP76_02485 [Candidatus Omnitrophota bacterium]